MHESDDEPEYEAVDNTESETSDQQQADVQSSVEQEINSILEEQQKRMQQTDDIVRSLTPQMLRRIMDSKIIGQEEAKKKLAVAIYNHAKRLTDTTGKIKKSNIFIVGPSGSGKTLFAQTIAQMVGVPLVIVDATTLTETGYMGKDVESILTRLYHAAGRDMDFAEKGIVYIDEVDKLSTMCQTNATKSVGQEGVQSALLKMIEGTKVDVPTTGNPQFSRTVTIDTKDILFIVGGAFPWMTHPTNVEDGQKRVVGFQDTNITLTPPPSPTPVSFNQESLIREGGMMSEFVGRFPVVVTLNALSEDELVQVMTDTTDSILDEYKELFKKDKIKLTFEDEALREVAHLAAERKVGARGLRAILEDVMLDIMYEAPGQSKIKECIITKDTIHTKQPVYKYRKRAVRHGRATSSNATTRTAAVG
jgi:ATP-dependent Clp protease ATP-binding subunit ClpX